MNLFNRSTLPGQTFFFDSQLFVSLTSYKYTTRNVWSRDGHRPRKIAYDFQGWIFDDFKHPLHSMHHHSEYGQQALKTQERSWGWHLSLFLSESNSRDADPSYDVVMESHSQHQKSAQSRASSPASGRDQEERYLDATWESF